MFLLIAHAPLSAGQRYAMKACSVEHAAQIRQAQKIPRQAGFFCAVAGANGALAFGRTCNDGWGYLTCLLDLLISPAHFY
jgi:hypothetical protein